MISSSFQSTRPLRGATDGDGCCHRRARISIHAPLAGRDVRCFFSPLAGFYFNPRAPCGARLAAHDHARVVVHISIHAPLAGRDLLRDVHVGGKLYFNPRAPCGARLISAAPDAPRKYFNPRAPCGARRDVVIRKDPAVSISIHAPLAGRDRRPHASRRNGRQFQSTRPLRGATSARAAPTYHPDRAFQSTRPLRGATQEMYPSFDLQTISIHAPLAGRDVCLCRLQRAGEHISIHAPLAGRDRGAGMQDNVQFHFNPRAPCGARLRSMSVFRNCTNFNPRAPCGARQTGPVLCFVERHISIHAPLAGRDPLCAEINAQLFISIHAPLAGRDLVLVCS